MSAGISRGALSLVTTDTMDEADQQGQGPTDPDASGTTGLDISDPDIDAARAALAASNRLGVLRPASERSPLYASIIKSIYTALEQDESFECLIERPRTGLELVHVFVAIRYCELTGELSRTEAKELRDSCESKMLEAATAKNRKNRITPKDIYAARKAAEAFTLNKVPAEDPLLDKAIARYEDKAEGRRVKTPKALTPTDEMLAKYSHKPLGDAIAEARNTGNFTVETLTDAGLKECSILEAVFWARKLGEIDNDKAFNLLRRCLGSMEDAGVECQAMDFIAIGSAGLFETVGEARGVFRMIRLSPVETQLFKEELEVVLGRQTAPTQSATPAQPGIAPSTPTSQTQPAIAAQATTTTRPEIDWTPQPSEKGWFPKSIPERLPHGALVFLQSRETRRAALEAVALAAIFVIGTKVISVINTGNSPQLQWKTQEVAAVEPSPTEPLSLGSITITISPDATKEAPETIQRATSVKIAVASEVKVPAAAPKPTPATTIPETATPVAVRIMAARADIQPEQPKAAQQTTVNLPITTKPGTYGGVTLDESASKKLWESAGYTIKARMGAGGKKVFVLSKNGRSFVTGDTKIAEGQTEIAASLEQ